MPRPLQLHRGDTWAFDLSVEDLPPLTGGIAQPFNLGGVVVRLAVGAPDGTGEPVLVESFDIPDSKEAAAGLARLMVLPAASQEIEPALYRLHVRLESPGAPAYAATQAWSLIRVLPSLLPEVAP